MFKLSEDEQLWFARGGEWIPVTASRCFPWSEPDRFISLKTLQGEELEIITDLKLLPEEHRQAVAVAATRSGFLFEVSGIESQDEEVELRNWKVQTLQGPRTFQTRLEDWPRPMPDGGLMLRDVAGDVYWIRDPEALDPRSREVIWPFIE